MRVATIILPNLWVYRAVTGRFSFVTLNGPSLAKAMYVPTHDEGHPPKHSQGA